MEPETEKMALFIDGANLYAACLLCRYTGYKLGFARPGKVAFWPPRASARCPYSIDAICIGSLWCADRTLPRAMPTKNIAAASITAIAP
jgi:hypothetical protein